jgi:HlyD family secretion protein
LASVRIRKVSATIGVAIVAVAGGLIGVSNWSSGAQPPPAPVAPSPGAIAALGRVEPESEIINIGAGTSPERVDSLLVGRGDSVQSGQVLGYLGGYAECTGPGSLDTRLS